MAVRDAAEPRLDHGDRRFHVFLPTQEPSGCSVLVNGAFTTDLSRQHVQVSESDVDYNSHLLRQAAATFVGTLVPHLLSEGGARYVLLVLDQDDGNAADAHGLMREELAGALADTPLLPSGPTLLRLRDAVLPAPALGGKGQDFAALL